MEDALNIGQHIARLRKARKLSQAKLAQILRVTPLTINRWENNHANPRIGLLGSLATALGVTVDALLASGDADVPGQLRLPGNQEVA